MKKEGFADFVIRLHSRRFCTIQSKFSSAANNYTSSCKLVYYYWSNANKLGELLSNMGT
jgi:hypothetical protein